MGLKDTVKLLCEYPIHLSTFKKSNLVKKTRWIKRLLRWYLFIVKLLPKYPFHIFVNRYVKYINKVVALNNNEFNCIKANWISYYKTLNEKHRFLMSKVFYTFNIFDDEVVAILIKDSLNFQKEEYKRWMFLDISRMSFMFPKSIYANYYIDRRELLDKVANDNKLELTNSIDKNGLVIMTYTLGDDLFNSATRLVKMISDGLLNYIDEINVICLDQFVITNKERRNLLTVFETPNPKGIEESLKKIFNKKVNVYFVGKGNRKQKDDKFTSILNKLNPKVIIDITDEYAYESLFYSDIYKTIYIPMRNYSSSSYYTYTLGVKWKYDLLNEIYHSVDESKMVEWSFPEYVPNKSEPISRKELGLKESSFVIVTIGKNEGEFSNNFTDSICEMLCKHNDVQWLIVGGNPPSYLLIKYQELIDNKSIVLRPFEKNLMGLTMSCDAVLRANTTAGSGGTAIAVMNGCPVVMTNMVCDPMRWLGRDYSRIKEVGELPEEILKLKDDKEYYLSQQAKCLSLVKEATNAEKRWNELNNLIKKVS